MTLSPSASTKPSTFPSLPSLQLFLSPLLSLPSVPCIRQPLSFLQGLHRQVPLPKNFFSFFAFSPVLARLHNLKGVRHLIVLGHPELSFSAIWWNPVLTGLCFRCLHCLREGILSVCSTQLTQHLTASLAWSRYFNKKHNQRKSAPFSQVL